jgi:hypothetical protein
MPKLVNEAAVEYLQEIVTEAEQARIFGNFGSITAMFLGTLYDGGFKDGQLTKQEQYLKVKERVNAPDYRAELEKNVELLAVGFLGMARIYLVAATSSFKNAEATDRELEQAFEHHQELFTALDYMHRIPQTIHGGVIDWLGEYVQDTANYYQVVGDTETASTVLADGIYDLEYQLQELEKVRRESANTFTSKDTSIYAGKLSALGVIYARHGRLNGNVREVIKGFNAVKQSHQLSPNPQRQQDMAKILLKEAKQNIAQTNPFITLKAVFLGAKQLIKKS